ncbi:glycosyltransferase [Anaerosoma tenue]|uniref:glycosyltransferase n=1 Tax=Anaerosoma tenue TaxID=2933588 RepID=UPI002260E09B|nr:glycosyltransferase [Anaerosoma tenue]MCK8114689.1 glycosyltransferase [Anaerosoma tenue]
MLLLNDFTADSRVMKEVMTLASANWRVTVVCLRGEGLPEVEVRDGYTIRRVADATSSPPGDLLGKLTEMRRRNRALIAAAVRESPDVVHCHDTDTLPAGGAVARAANARLVYDAHELFLEQIRGHARGRFAQAHWSRVESRWIPRCDLCIAANGIRARLLSERYGVPFETLLNLPEIEPLSGSDRLRDELDIGEGSPIVLYQGILIVGRALERLVRAAARIPGVHVVIQGSGPLGEPMRQAAADAGVLDRVHFMGHIAPGELHSYACGADVGVVIYEDISLNNYYAAPNKLWAYLMAGVPVASSDFPGLHDVVAGQGVGVVFDPADEDSIESALATLIGDAESRYRMGRRARRLAEKRYNWGVESGRLIAMYEGLRVNDGGAK